MPVINVKTIPKDAVVDLKMSSGFYNALTRALLGHCQMPIEDLSKMLVKLKNRTIDNNADFITLLLIELIHGFEQAAYQQDLLKDSEFTIDLDSSEEDVPES